MPKRRRSSESDDDQIAVEEYEFQEKQRCLSIRSFMTIMHSDVLQLIKLCLKPENDEKMESLLEDFLEKFNDCVFLENVEDVDIFCKFALVFLYENNYTIDSVVSRLLYAYVKNTGSCSVSDLNELELQNDVEITDSDNFLTAVASFTLTMQGWNAETLSCILFRVLESGQLGFLHFLIKYGLTVFLPIENHQMIRCLIRNLL